MKFYSDSIYSVKVLNCFCINPQSVSLLFVKYISQFIFMILNLRLIFNQKANIPDHIIQYITYNLVESNKKNLIDIHLIMVTLITISHSFKL